MILVILWVDEWGWRRQADFLINWKLELKRNTDRSRGSHMGVTRSTRSTKQTQVKVFSFDHIWENSAGARSSRAAKSHSFQERENSPVTLARTRPWDVRGGYMIDKGECTFDEDGERCSKREKRERERIEKENDRDPKSRESRRSTLESYSWTYRTQEENDRRSKPKSKFTDDRIVFRWWEVLKIFESLQNVSVGAKV